MFLLAGFNPKGRAVCWALMSTDGGFARWTRLWRFDCGEMAWVGRRFGFAVRDAAAVYGRFRLPQQWQPVYWGDRKNVSNLDWEKPRAKAATECRA